MNLILSKFRQFRSDERGVSSTLEVVVLIAVAALVVIVLYKVIGTGAEGEQNTFLSVLKSGVNEVFSLGGKLFTAAKGFIRG